MPSLIIAQEEVNAEQARQESLARYSRMEGTYYRQAEDVLEHLKAAEDDLTQQQHIQQNMAAMMDVQTHTPICLNLNRCYRR